MAAGGAVDAMAQCHSEVVEGLGVLIDLALHEGHAACFEVAEALLYETLEAECALLGPRDPMTLRVLAKLAQLLHAMGRAAEAEEVYLSLALTSHAEEKEGGEQQEEAWEAEHEAELRSPSPARKATYVGGRRVRAPELGVG